MAKKTKIPFDKSAKHDDETKDKSLVKRMVKGDCLNKKGPAKGKSGKKK